MAATNTNHLVIAKYKELVETFYCEPSDPNDYVGSFIKLDEFAIDFEKDVVPKKARKSTI